MSKYLDLSIDKLHEMLVSKEITPLDLTMEALERAESDKLNCFITIDKSCIDFAKSIGEPEEDNVLWGIPCALKDNLMTKNLRTTCGSLMLDNFVPTYDAHVVSLIKDKKMIIIGKLNMDEFAMGSSNKTSYYGPVLNPWNNALVSGGSSGGSAAAVCSGIVPITLGSDTGGSIRQPSAFCGVVGLKPTYGRVSRFGLAAFSSSLDQIGPITRNVKENAYMLDVISKKDKRDLTNEDKEEDFTRLIGEDISGMKVLVPNFYVSDLIDDEILDKFKETVKVLESMGVTVDYKDVPYLEYAVPLYQVIALGEASSNLARYDGIKYGYSAKNCKNAEDYMYKTRSEAFGDEVKRRIMVGSFMLSGSNVKEYYTKALMIRNKMKEEFDNIFKEYDLVLGPSSTCLPYEVESFSNDPNKAFVDDILVIPVNLAGLPGMSLPVGFSKSNLPIGMQIIGNRWDEATMYKFAYKLEEKLSLNLSLGGNKNE